MEPLGDCVLCVTILDSSSRMYLCELWDGLTLFTCVRDQREYRWCVRAVEV